MSFTILTDTSCNLPQHLVDEWGIEMIPLRYIVDGQPHSSYTDGKQADFHTFYEKLRSGALVTTSCVDMHDSLESFKRLLEAGQDVLYLGFSSGLSATYEVASAAARELAPQYPHRKIHCIDTLAASAGQGLFIAYVARMRAAGKSIDECADWAQEHRLNIMHWFTVDDLMFLKRGGRVSSVSAVFGTMLAIKPILHVAEDGTLKVVSKVQGRKKSIRALADKFLKNRAPLPEGMERIIYISHGDCEEEAQALAKMIADGYDDPAHPLDAPLVVYIDPVIGTHSGPGTLALFYYDDASHR